MGWHLWHQDLESWSGWVEDTQHMKTLVPACECCRTSVHTCTWVFLCRVSYLVPEDFSAPLELPQKQFGLVDDYGIKPKQPRFRTQVAQKGPTVLRRAGKTKRDGLDLLEYYDDARL
ncbi:protein Frey 1 isoform X1 [Pithys albifrons albifrons]|uniref:protein Frey 1 isoform X1 n=1 Tax=Pithys albifrons albifrons TaxID=3385563 RepID=UPI003A5CBC5E